MVKMVAKGSERFDGGIRGLTCMIARARGLLLFFGGRGKLVWDGGVGRVVVRG